MRIGMVSEMIIKCKDGVETEMVYQDKTCAVGKTQPSVLNSSEDNLGSGFNISGNPLNVYMSFVYLVHKLDGRSVAIPHLKESIGFIQDIIRGINNRLSFLKAGMNGLGLWIVQVLRNGEGAEGACVYKDLQSVTAPYRYLS